MFILPTLFLKNEKLEDGLRAYPCLTKEFYYSREAVEARGASYAEKKRDTGGQGRGLRSLGRWPDVEQ